MMLYDEEAITGFGIQSTNEKLRIIPEGERITL